MERDENLTIVIQGIQVGYAKAFKGTWHECDWKSVSNKMMQHWEFGFLK
jgi:hypothetical protein